MKPGCSIGIAGYGTYVLAYRLSTAEISEQWRNGSDRLFLPVKQKSVPDMDEDTITMSIEAAKNALDRSALPAEK